MNPARASSRAARRLFRLGRLLPIPLLLVAACSRGPALHRAGGAIAGEQVVPLATVVASGHRYVASADLGLGKPVPLMVHGNAALYLSLTHAVGERLIGGPVRKLENFGYSSKGRGAVDVPLLRLGGLRLSDLHAVPVFDFDERADSVIQGMLGVSFLTAQRAAVDFTRDALILGVPTAREADAGLLRRGYRCVRLSITAQHRVTIPVYFPALGREIPVTPSTVANALTLHQRLFAGRLPMRKAPSPDLSPRGTTPEEFLSDRVEFAVAGARLSSPASFEDFAEYADTTEAALESYGMLGYDWMKEHGAVLDYANRVLYFKP